ncbi:MAG: signal peptidase II [Acidobacteria bacterium]|nr:signal peptidase II [Acidobacteriota bacterium]
MTVNAASSQRTIALMAVAIVVIDQITKWVITGEVALHTRLPLVDGLLAFTHVHNRGMAFGLFNTVGSPWLRWVLAGVAVLAVVIIWSYARHEVARPTVLVAFGCILGGAVGNLIDRVRFGYVEDFILAHWNAYEFPAFNVADAAITMGGVALFLSLAREPEEPEASPPPQDDTNTLAATANDVSDDA